MFVAGSGHPNRHLSVHKRLRVLHRAIRAKLSLANLRLHMFPYGCFSVKIIRNFGLRIPIVGAAMCGSSDLWVSAHSDDLLGTLGFEAHGSGMLSALRHALPG